MNESVLRAFSPSAQNALRLLAKSPDDAVHFHDRLTVFRSALLIGIEVMERGAEHSSNPDAARAGAIAAMGACAAIECCMSTLEGLHPSLGRRNAAAPPTMKVHPGENGAKNRLRILDLDDEDPKPKKAP